jgi:hypothetical protein
MKDIGIVTGNAEQAKPLVIGKDKVYVHTDIVKIEKDFRGKPVEDLYSYHEVQYDKDEYIAIMAEENEKLNETLIDTQLALCEVYEMMGE